MVPPTGWYFLPCSLLVERSLTERRARIDKETRMAAMDTRVERESMEAIFGSERERERWPAALRVCYI